MIETRSTAGITEFLPADRKLLKDNGIFICKVGRTVPDLIRDGLILSTSSDLLDELSRLSANNIEVGINPENFIQAETLGWPLVEQEEIIRDKFIAEIRQMGLTAVTAGIGIFPDYLDALDQYHNSTGKYVPVTLNCRTRSRVYPNLVSSANFVAHFGPYDLDQLQAGFERRDDGDPQIGAAALYVPSRYPSVSQYLVHHI